MYIKIFKRYEKYEIQYFLFIKYSSINIEDDDINLFIIYYQYQSLDF